MCDARIVRFPAVPLPTKFELKGSYPLWEAYRLIVCNIEQDGSASGIRFVQSKRTRCPPSGQEATPRHQIIGERLSHLAAGIAHPSLGRPHTLITHAKGNDEVFWQDGSTGGVLCEQSKRARCPTSGPEVFHAKIYISALPLCMKDKNCSTGQVRFHFLRNIIRARKSRSEERSEL